MGTQVPSPQLLRPNVCRDQDANWYGGRTPHKQFCVRWGPRSTSPKRGGPQKFSARVYCGQTAGWIKIVVGMEVGLRPGDFALDGDPVASRKKGGAHSLVFGPFLLWSNGCMDQDATWHGGRSQPRQLCSGAPSPISAHAHCGQTAG